MLEFYQILEQEDWDIFQVLIKEAINPWAGLCKVN